MLGVEVLMLGGHAAERCAEGVETEAQLARVIEGGCTRAQGYLFSPPVPSDAFVHLVQGSGTISG